MATVLRPYGILVNGSLELGVELLLEGGVIQELRPHTGIPEDFVVSPAFVNAHSHMEYRGMQGKIQETEYWPWIREITRLKQAESALDVEEACLLAAQENRRTGVALIGEHSDRPYAGKALAQAGLGGVIFQEVITFFERETREEKLRRVRMGADQNQAASGIPVFLSPHAYHTVDPQTLREIGASGEPFSIHVAETPLESQFTRTGTGAIADFYRANGVPFEPSGKSMVETLDALGLARQGAQFVHCCAVSQSEIELMAAKGVKIAHCPRSNSRLKCPAAPVREMLDAGIDVGLGLDSPASSGPIDMFEEMRAALAVSVERGKPLTPEEIWRMATHPKSLPVESRQWEIAPGSATPLIKIAVPGALHTSDLIERAMAGDVEFV